jgi:hypothetical protein
MTDRTPYRAIEAGGVELRGVTKRDQTGSDEPAVGAHDVNVRIEPGALVALAGASGSGKSTLLHLIGAIERPDSGTIISGSVEVTKLRGGAVAAYRRTVGFVFQRYNLLPALTALDNVIAPVLPYRTGWDKAARGRELLAAAWPAASGPCPDGCPAASSSASRSPAPWSTPPPCCWPTRPPATWTPTPPRPSSVC